MCLFNSEGFAFWPFSLILLCIEIYCGCSQITGDWPFPKILSLHIFSQLFDKSTKQVFSWILAFRKRPHPIESRAASLSGSIFLSCGCYVLLFVLGKALFSDKISKIMFLSEKGRFSRTKMVAVSIAFTNTPLFEDT